MLAYLKNGASVALDFDDYYIQEEWFGADDTLAFTLPADHPQLPDMMCQLSLTDKESGQAFLITNIDEGDVKAKIDLDEFREQMFLSYTNGSATALATAQQVLPAGWSVQDFSGSTARRTIEAEGATALEILQKLPDTYGIAVRFDRRTKRVLLRNPDAMAPSGTYLTEELNLRKRPVRSQTSESFATRLYAVGKDGVTFASINSGKNYVENHEYSDRVISAYWKDERYTDPQSLLDDAKKKLSEMAKPAQSYECDVADLAKIDPTRFGHLSMEMYQAVTLMDAERGTRLAHRVVQYKRYPHYPEKNVVTLSTLPGTISGKVEQSYQAVTNPNSSFQQQLAANLQGVAQTIVGAKGGSVKFIQDEKGKPIGVLFMDTEDEATAKNILRINHMGLAFSNKGSSGPWTQAITIDGGLANQWIETWQLTASIIVAGILQSRDGKSFWNLETGELNLNGVFKNEDEEGFSVMMDAGQFDMYYKDTLVGRVGTTSSNSVGGSAQYYSLEKQNGQAKYSSRSDHFGHHVNREGTLQSLGSLTNFGYGGGLSLFSLNMAHGMMMNFRESQEPEISLDKKIVAESRDGKLNVYAEKINGKETGWILLQDYGIYVLGSTDASAFSGVPTRKEEVAP